MRKLTSEYKNHKKNLQKIYNKKSFLKENKKPKMFEKIEHKKLNLKKRKMIELSIKNRTIYNRLKNIESDFNFLKDFKPNTKADGFFFKQRKQKIKSDNKDLDFRLKNVKCKLNKKDILKETNSFVQYFRRNKKNYMVRANMFFNKKKFFD